MEDRKEKIKSHGPIETTFSKILILGSMPSIASLEKGQYYGHPQNHFWPLLFHVLEEACPNSYAGRVARLKERGVAVWDSISRCRRQGSLDKDIKEMEPNDIPGFLATHGNVGVIVFNGAMAQKAHDGFFKRREGTTYLLLPSSSPVPRRKIKTMADKLPYWLILREYL